MTEETITCEAGAGGSTCYSVSNDGASVGRGASFRINGPDDTLITWDDANNPAPMDSATLKNGKHTWTISPQAPTGTYYYTPTNTGCDNPCGSTDKPSMVVD